MKSTGTLLSALSAAVLNAVVASQQNGGVILFDWLAVPLLVIAAISAMAAIGFFWLGPKVAGPAALALIVSVVVWHFIGDLFHAKWLLFILAIAASFARFYQYMLTPIATSKKGDMSIG